MEKFSTSNSYIFSSKVNNVVDKVGTVVNKINHANETVASRVPKFSIPVSPEVPESSLIQLERIIGPMRIESVDHASPDHFIERSVSIHIFNKEISRHLGSFKNKKILFTGAKYSKEIKTAVKKGCSNVHNLIVPNDQMRTFDNIGEDLPDSNIFKNITYQQLEQEGVYEQVYSVHSVYDMDYDNIYSILTKSKKKSMRVISFLTPNAYRGIPETYKTEVSFYSEKSIEGHKLIMNRKDSGATYINVSTVHKAISLYGGYWYFDKFFRIDVRYGLGGIYAYDLKMLDMTVPFVHNIKYDYSFTSFVIDDKTYFSHTKHIDELAAYAFKNNSSKNFIEAAMAYYTTKLRLDDELLPDDFEYILTFSLIKGYYKRQFVGETFQRLVNEDKREIGSTYQNFKKFLKSIFSKGKKEFEETELERILKSEKIHKSYTYNYTDSNIRRILDFNQSDIMYETMVNGIKTSRNYSTGLLYLTLDQIKFLAYKKLKSTSQTLFDELDKLGNTPLHKYIYDKLNDYYELNGKFEPVFKMLDDLVNATHLDLRNSDIYKILQKIGVDKEEIEKIVKEKLRVLKKNGSSEALRYFIVNYSLCPFEASDLLIYEDKIYLKDNFDTSFNLEHKVISFSENKVIYFVGEYFPKFEIRDMFAEVYKVDSDQYLDVFGVNYIKNEIISSSDNVDVGDIDPTQFETESISETLDEETSEEEITNDTEIIFDEETDEPSDGDEDEDDNNDSPVNVQDESIEEEVIFDQINDNEASTREEVFKQATDFVSSLIDKDLRDDQKELFLIDMETNDIILSKILKFLKESNLENYSSFSEWCSGPGDFTFAFIKYLEKENKLDITWNAYDIAQDIPKHNFVQIRDVFQEDDIKSDLTYANVPFGSVRDNRLNAQAILRKVISRTNKYVFFINVANYDKDTFHKVSNLPIFPVHNFQLNLPRSRSYHKYDSYLVNLTLYFVPVETFCPLIKLKPIDDLVSPILTSSYLDRAKESNSHYDEVMSNDMKTIFNLIDGDLKPLVIPGDPNKKVVVAILNEFLKTFIFENGDDPEKYKGVIADVYRGLTVLKTTFKTMNINRKKIVIINGLYGCGKTVFTSNIFNPDSDIYVCPFRGVTTNTKNDLKAKFGQGKNMVVETFDKVFPYLNNYYGSLFVDEYRNYQLGKLLATIFLFAGDTVYLLGGDEQGQFHYNGDESYNIKYLHEHFPLDIDEYYYINTTLRMSGPGFNLVNALHGNKYHSLSKNHAKVHIVLDQFGHLIPNDVPILTARTDDKKLYRDNHQVFTFKSATGLSEKATIIHFDSFTDRTFTQYLDNTTVAFSREKNDIYFKISRELDFNTSKFRVFLENNAIEFDYLTASGEFYEQKFFH